MAGNIIVHDPRGYPPKVTGKRLAPRLASLDGKIVYLVDCLFDNSAAFMEQMRQWFAAHLPAVETRIIKPHQSRTIDLTITPSRDGTAGTVVHGTLYVDVFAAFNELGAGGLTGSDVIAIPYEYTIG